jgi:hypothetical protein
VKIFDPCRYRVTPQRLFGARRGRSRLYRSNDDMKIKDTIRFHFNQAPWALYVRLPWRAQAVLYRAAMASENFQLAWDMADHANCDMLDVDAMMRKASDAHFWAHSKAEISVEDSVKYRAMMADINGGAK